MVVPPGSPPRSRASATDDQRDDECRDPGADGRLGGERQRAELLDERTGALRGRARGRTGGGGDGLLGTGDDARDLGPRVVHGLRGVGLDVELVAQCVHVRGQPVARGLDVGLDVLGRRLIVRRRGGLAHWWINSLISATSVLTLAMACFGTGAAACCNCLRLTRPANPATTSRTTATIGAPSQVDIPCGWPDLWAGSKVMRVAADEVTPPTFFLVVLLMLRREAGSPAIRPIRLS